MFAVLSDGCFAGVLFICKAIKWWVWAIRNSSMYRVRDALVWCMQLRRIRNSHNVTVRRNYFEQAMFVSELARHF